MDINKRLFGQRLVQINDNYYGCCIIPGSLVATITLNPKPPLYNVKVISCDKYSSAKINIETWEEVEKVAKEFVKMQLVIMNHEVERIINP